MRMTITKRIEWDLPDPYDNPHGVLFSGDIGNLISVGCNWPDFNKIKLWRLDSCMKTI